MMIAEDERNTMNSSKIFPDEEDNEIVPDLISSIDTQHQVSEPKVTVKVVNPEKVGEGMSSYVIYTVKSTTNMPVFRSSSMCVQRRFSDFITLHEKLRAKYLQDGLIIPSAPEKNVVGTAKIRLLKSSSADSGFIEKRRVSLECFLHRIVNHPVLVHDNGVHEFLEHEGELPRNASGQALSSSSALKLLKNVGEVVGKLTFRMDEVDEYFDLKEEELENWDLQGSKLYAAFSTLSLDQNGLSNKVVPIFPNPVDFASSTLATSKALSVLANVEEHTGLARALGQLADAEERIAHLLSLENEAQSTFLVEYAKGVLSTVQACRDTLGERVRVYKMRRDCESALRGKREQKVRIEMSPKADRAKIPTLEREIGELVHRVDESDEVFGKISTTIKREFEHVDEARFEEFKAVSLSYLTMELQLQEKTQKIWESFIGHARAIE